MTGRLIECVPNFSEGRRPGVIEAIVAPFRGRPGVRLLDHRADPDHNRLVVSLVGEPGPVSGALLESCRTAVASIDLRTHRGAHPRIGAVDVVPFVPLRGMPMRECVELARDFGRRFNRETGVPVYFYEDAAMRPERRKLEDVRRGQFEALCREIGRPERAPDVGEPAVHPSAGATAVGARRFLVAFNVNLATRDLSIAKAIAKAVRASSGGLPDVKAVGVDLADRGMVQVSMNLTDHERSPMHLVLERVRAEARSRGVEIAETEIYGMVPAAAMLDAAAHYLQATAFEHSQVIEMRLLDGETDGETGR
ncbi:MAG: glutamate formimidoyltransferase [Spirochaetes bacterium]|nr:glutamate formimidoyltransferase [Spirochaetota bacterium]